jgi:hypothetical protein
MSKISKKINLKNLNMKKICFILTVLLMSNFGFSQETETPNFKKNELKGNALFLILGSLDMTYERILNEESGVGIALSIPVDKYNWDINFSATGFYRYYFGEKPAAGFFGEAFGMVNNVDDWIYYEDGNEYNYRQKTLTDFALGVGLGGKWVTKKGLLLEINAGIGRNLFNSKYERDFELIGRGGITLGYRF